MRSHTVATLTTSALLGLIAGASFLMPSHLTVPAASAQAADSYQIVGVLRDFRIAHPDFNRTEAASAGHYAGLIARQLQSDGRPALAGPPVGEGGGTEDADLVAYWDFEEGAGTSVTDSSPAGNVGTLLNGPAWVPGHDGGSALHFDSVDDYINVPDSPEMRVTDDVTIAGWFKLDETFDDSSAETLVVCEKYGSDDQDTHIAIVGNDYNRLEVSRGAFVFKVENHAGTGVARYKWTNQTTWNAGQWYHFACVYNAMESSKNRIFIDGVDDTSGVDYGSDEPIDMDFAADFRLGGRDLDQSANVPGQTYFKGTLDDFMIFRRQLTEDDFEGGPGYKVVTQWTDAAANPIAPHLYGVGVGGTGLDACGAALADVAGTPGAPGSGGITDAGTFDEWFRDKPGVTQSIVYAITLTRSGGVYSYLNPAFTPMDDNLFGNEEESHNNNFTYAFTASFTYDECAGDFIEFEGGDGAWIFIDGSLVVDLGGVRTGSQQYIALDRLGLTDGTVHTIEFFYAQRQPDGSAFRLRTTLDLSGASTSPTVSAMFD